MKKITFLTFLFFSVIAFGQNNWIKTNSNTTVNPTIEVIQTSSEGMTLKLTTNAYALDEVVTPRGNELIPVSPKCSNIYVKAAPSLPYYTTSINIPDLGGLKCEVISAEYETLTDISVAPSKGTIYRNVNPNDVPYEYGRQYQMDEFFPQSLISSSDAFIIRDLRGSNLTFNTFTYNPIQKELRIYSEIIVKVKFTNEPSINEIEITKSTRVDEFENIYNRLFVNYKSSSKYTPIEEGAPGNILIIAKDTYASAMTNYINWKREKGIATEMVLMSTIGTTSAQLKTYIQNYYDNNGLSYVLLVGDAADVPTMVIGGNDADNGYTYLAGGDGYADIFIGRFSGNTLADIQTQVERTVYYEKALSTSDTWLGNAFGSASSEGDGMGHDGGESDALHINNIKTDLQDYGYAVTVVNQGGTNAQIATAFNAGIGLANYIGHGDWNQWVNTTFTNTEVNALNNAKKLPFIFSVACVNGDFSGQTCFAEAWLRAQNSGNATGAVGFLGATINQSWTEPMTGQDEMNDILIESYATNIKRTYGGIAFNGMFLMIQEGGEGQTMADTWTLFGDPSFMVRTQTPTLMTINHQPTISVGQTSFQVNCNVDNALVSLTKVNGADVEIVGYAYASGGVADITITPFDAPGNMKVTVTAFNKVTYQADVLIIVPDGPYVVDAGYSIDDSEGNNNGQADYFESFYINQSLHNVGVQVAEGVDAVIAISNPSVEILDNTEVFGDITVDETITMDQAYSISIPDGIADQTMLGVNMIISDNNTNEWTANYTITVNAPAMQLSFVEVDDAGFGNGNGTLDPGETVNIVVQVLNIGHAISQSGLVTIGTANGYVNITNYEANFNAQAPNTPINLSFEVQLPAEELCGPQICFEFLLGAGLYEAQLNTCLPVGVQIEDWESADFTTYEWDNSDVVPWVIVTNQFYEGSHSAKSGTLTAAGGQSTLIINLDVLTAENVDFYKKVSCEPLYFGTMYDYLAFFIDGSMKNQWCGEVAWSLQSYPVTIGNHELKWTYFKDSEVTSGSDCAWIDNVKLPAHQSSITMINDNTEVAENSVELYPNPASNMVNLNVNMTENTIATIKVMNINGQVVFEFNNEFTIYKGQNSILLNTESFANGLYIVQVTTSNQIYHRNLVISK
jgi:hypothetical protein